MPKCQSEASCFESTRGGGWISVGQFLAEFICLRQAAAKGIDLPNHFWRLSVWEKVYLRQLRAANSLLRAYEPAAISRALRSKEGRRVFSLSAPWLDDLVAHEQRKLEVERALATAALSKEPNSGDGPPVASGSRPTFKTSQSALDKLKD